MKSIRISLEISSPILVPKFPIHLDALLFASYQLNTDLPDEEILNRMNEVLATQDGIYKASAMRYIRTKQTPIHSIQWSLVTRTHWEEWPYSQHQREKTVVVKGGGFRKRVTEYNAISTGAVDFHAVGDPQKIKYLLDNLGYIGLNNSQGFGEITAIHIEEDEDFSFFDEQGELARSLPIHFVDAEKNESYLRIFNSFKPPYQTSERVESLIPNFRLKTIGANHENN